MTRFVLWFIRTFLNTKTVITELVDHEGHVSAVPYHCKELQLWYNCATDVQREEMLETLYYSLRFDRRRLNSKLEYSIADIISTFTTLEASDEITTSLVQRAKELRNESNGYVKLTAALTNVVKAYVGDRPANDVQLIVALLRKRVER